MQRSWFRQSYGDGGVDNLRLGHSAESELDGFSHAARGTSRRCRQNDVLDREVESREHPKHRDDDRGLSGAGASGNYGQRSRQRCAHRVLLLRRELNHPPVDDRAMGKNAVECVEDLHVVAALGLLVETHFQPSCELGFLTMHSLVVQAPCVHDERLVITGPADELTRARENTLGNSDQLVVGTEPGQTFGETFQIDVRASVSEHAHRSNRDRDEGLALLWSIVRCRARELPCQIQSLVADILFPDGVDEPLGIRCCLGLRCTEASSHGTERSQARAHSRSSRTSSSVHVDTLVHDGCSQ